MNLSSRLEEMEGVDHVNNLHEEIEIYITNENMDGYVMFEVMLTLMKSSCSDVRLTDLDSSVGICLVATVREHDLQ